MGFGSESVDSGSSVAAGEEGAGAADALGGGLGELELARAVASLFCLGNWGGRLASVGGRGSADEERGSTDEGDVGRGSEDDERGSADEGRSAADGRAANPGSAVPASEESERGIPDLGGAPRYEEEGLITFFVVTVMLGPRLRVSPGAGANGSTTAGSAFVSTVMRLVPNFEELRVCHAFCSA